MKCPSCGGAVEDGADLCLECGEPMGDSPAARSVRAEGAPRPPSSEESTAPVPKLAPAPTAKAAAPAVKPRARPKEDPEPVRCPGCGIPTTRERCPGCGVILRRSEE